LAIVTNGIAMRFDEQPALAELCQPRSAVTQQRAHLRQCGLVGGRIAQRSVDVVRVGQQQFRADAGAGHHPRGNRRVFGLDRGAQLFVERELHRRQLSSSG
jgi:hypothetical protein